MAQEKDSRKSYFLHAAFAVSGKRHPDLGRHPAAQLTAKYYEAAKKEGKVVIYGLGPPFLGPITEAFNKRYPGIQIEAFDEQGRETRERVIAEQKAGRVIGDVVIGGASLHQVLFDLGFLESYRSLQLPFIIPELITEGGFTNPFRATIVSLAINTKLVPGAEEPKIWADVLSQKFNGRIAADDPRGSGNGGSPWPASNWLLALSFFTSWRPRTYSLARMKVCS